MNRVLWRPTSAQVANSAMTAFSRAAGDLRGAAFEDYSDLHSWSVQEREAFWSLVWDFCELRGERGSQRVCNRRDELPGAQWFPDARLNFAENLLCRRDDAIALIGIRENGDRNTLSFAELYQQVARLSAALRAHSVGVGDRVAAYLPNIPEAVIGMLASASIGALWSSCSPDFGTRGVVDRFGQIEPRVLLCGDGYDYGGKRFDRLPRIREVMKDLPTVEHCVVIGVTRGPDELRAALPGDRRWSLYHDWLDSHPSDEILFAALPFDHPVYVLYSSGTTGAPKCIVHGAGGTLLQHLKEHRLHVDLRAGERIFYFTTCGWMMWNWLVSALASKATVVLYDGSPFHPQPDALFTLAESEQINVLGVSAKFLDAAAKQGLSPRETHDLSSVRTILSTGSPLAPEGFDYVYQKVAPQAQLASISGGTDIISCFVLGNPTAPVRRGEIQCAGLGMDVAAVDDEGRPVSSEAGELVCCAPFTAVPRGFWNDPEGERFRAAYFERFPGKWHHGDWIRRTESDGFVIEGRSDAVLNPGGVRIGTAEIYRQVERLPEVAESIAVGQQWDGDVRIVLFVILLAGCELGDPLRDRIRAAIRQHASPRHVPARILQVPDIPRTRSGKITELAVREVIHGRPVKNREALANPEALDHFRSRPELAG